MTAIALYRMNFNKEGPIDPQLFKMCKDAHKYQESLKVNSLVNEMTLNEPDLFKLADEIGNYFDDEAEPMDTD
jgi:hypothetical protein